MQRTSEDVVDPGGSQQPGSLAQPWGLRPASHRHGIGQLLRGFARGVRPLDVRPSRQQLKIPAVQTHESAERTAGNL